MPPPTPPSAASAQTAVTVLLTNDQTAFLDEVAAEIRRETGGCISRSAILRAMISALNLTLRSGSSVVLKPKLKRS